MCFRITKTFSFISIKFIKQINEMHLAKFSAFVFINKFIKQQHFHYKYIITMKNVLQVKLKAPILINAYYIFINQAENVLS